MLAVAIGVLHCRLCFADASQTAKSLWLGDRNGLLSVEKGFMELHKDVFASCEEKVTAIGDIPERGGTFLKGKWWREQLVLSRRALGPDPVPGQFSRRPHIASGGSTARRSDPPFPTTDIKWSRANLIGHILLRPGASFPFLA